MSMQIKNKSQEYASILSALLFYQIYARLKVVAVLLNNCSNTIIYKFFYISMVVFPHKYVIIHDEIWQSASVFSLFSINIVSCNPTDIPCIFEIFRRQHIPLAP
nr:MAG TPA: hypothetical protein [Caudoviricetes sp.]